MLAEDRIRVGAVVGVGMADKHCIESGRVVGREGRSHAVPGVDQEAEPIRLDDVPTARAAMTGVPAAASDNSQSHCRRLASAPSRLAVALMLAP